MALSARHHQSFQCQLNECCFQALIYIFERRFSDQTIELFCKLLLIVYSLNQYRVAKSYVCIRSKTVDQLKALLLCVSVTVLQVWQTPGFWK